MMIGYAVSAFWLSAHCVILQIVFTTIGRIFVEAEVPRIDN